MHLNEVLAWIDSHPGLPMVHGGKYKPKTIKVKISDSAKASAGGGAGSAAPGIRARRSDGGGGGQMSPQESKPPEVEKKQSQLAAYQQRAAAAQQQYQQQKEAGIRAAQEAKERISQKTTTGVYEKGGAVIRETRTKTKDPVQSKAELDRLQKQQPGSVVVQTASGEYVLIKSTGLNLSNEATLAKVNENIEREGGSGYSPTSVPQAGGGFLNIAKMKDTVRTSEPEPPKDGGPVMAQSDFLIDKSRPTKYTAKVGEGSVLVEQGALYQIGLSDSMGGLTPGEKQYSQKELELFWKYHPRELAKGISEGIYETQFIGKRGPGIIAYEKIGKEEEPQVFPITYTTEEGEPLVTITGKSPGAEYKIFSTDKTTPFIPKDTTLIGPAGSNTIISMKKEDYRILPAYGPPTKPETQGPPKKNIVQQAEEKSPLYPLIGEYGKGSKESLKGYIKEGYHIGAEIGLMFVPSEISGIDDPKKREELRRAIDKPYPKELEPKETPLTNLLSGKLPVTPYGLKYDIGATATDIFLLGSGIPKIEKIGGLKSFSFQSPRSKVSQLEAEYLKEPGKVSGVEKISEEQYIISKGTETKPAAVPLTLVKFPQKGPATAREIIPEKVLSPSETNIQGSLFPSFAKALEAKKIGPFQYKSTAPSLAARQEYQRGIMTGGIKPIAAGRTAKVADILSGKSEKLRRAAKQPQATYAQTQAETTKFIPPKNILVPPKPTSQKGLREFSYGPEPIKPRVGAGQLARGFTPKETETIKSALKAEARLADKPREDFLGTIHAPSFMAAIEAEALIIQYPLGTSPKGAIDIMQPTTQRSESLLGTRILQRQQPITIQKLGISQKGKSISTQASKLLEKTIQKTQLKISPREALLPRLDIRPALVTRQKQVIVPRLTTKQITKQKEIEVPRIPKEEIVKERFPKIPFFALPQPRKKEKKEPTETKSAFSWKGNVPEFQIEGVYKKYDIIYGEKRIAKLLKQEQFGKPKRKAKAQYDILGFPKTKKAKSSKWAF